MIRLVAISASYGAGGSKVGSALAERLGVPFVDRAIPMAVAERLDVDYEEAAAHDTTFRPGSWIERVLSAFAGGETGVPAPLPADTVTSEDFRRATEEALLRQAAKGEGVILGRGAAIVLRDDPGVLRVRLDGPAERRIEQAMRLGGVDRDTATRALHQLDRVHADYVSHFYGVQIDDPSNYHLTLDSTAIPFGTCVELILQTARTIGVPFGI